MSERKESKIPFVNFHSHTTFSVFDGMGYPEDHMNFVWQNGGDAMAITDHGNMNALSYQVEAYKKMKAEGKEVKPIFGIEAYFIPSIKKWKEEYDAVRSSKKEAETSTSIEDEDASRKKIKNVLNRRHHIILLAQNEVGLKNLFQLVSKSFRSECFYRYPRIDYRLLKKHNEGLIASSACIGGIYGACYWQNRDDGDNAVLDSMR